ncbi:TIGR04282 family arsenosugar biosynthesis glycosyltransferase [Cellulophaga fucicola]|uniref:DUF2064 domain-containing protein n=1 Tax=Cellulophaga fucicola TaxID=76595 RepID=A0A1K1QAM1_9FLAO|nr:DUF2064 domain-containing protein [Cellulophaga fucicola]SFW56772.1 hypothetical protein SAMN05660313_02513 [Cellulophaga fucicola]
MRLHSNKTVLLVFSLSARLEAERKPLFGGQKRNVSKQFFNLLISNTLKVAHKSGVDVVWLDETQQQGDTFAERYTNAYKSLYAQGYTNVVSIGNDTPNLTAKHIQYAIEALATKQVVFGPSKDGGIYLLGLNKAAFNEHTFKNLPWLTSGLATEINALAVANTESYTVLETLVDIDTTKSVLHFAYANPTTVLSSFILKHIHKTEHTAIKITTSVVSSFYASSFLRRGPPSA